MVLEPLASRKQVEYANAVRLFQHKRSAFATIGRRLKTDYLEDIRALLDQEDTVKAERLLFSCRDYSWDPNDAHVVMVCDSAFRPVAQYRSVVVPNDSAGSHDMIGYQKLQAMAPTPENVLPLIGEELLSHLTRSGSVWLTCYYDQVNQGGGVSRDQPEYLEISARKRRPAEIGRMIRTNPAWSLIGANHSVVAESRLRDSGNVNYWKIRDLVMASPLAARSQYVVLVWRDGFRSWPDYDARMRRLLLRFVSHETEDEDFVFAEKDPSTGLTFFFSAAGSFGLFQSFLQLHIFLGFIMVGFGLFATYFLFHRIQTNVNLFSRESGDFIERLHVSPSPAKLMDYLHAVFRNYNSMMGHFLAPYQRVEVEEAFSRNLETVSGLLDELIEVKKKDAIQSTLLGQKTAELEAARRLQLSMLPTENMRTPHIEIFGMMRMATEVGGDYYDIFRLSDSRYCVAIGDATGHGMASGLVVAMVKMALLNALLLPENIPTPVELLKHLNGALKRTLSRQKIGMGLCLAYVDTKKKVLDLCSSGLPLPYVLDARTGRIGRPVMKGPPLGYLSSIDPVSFSTPFNPDDILILATDGLMERFDPAKEQWGDELMQTEIEGICRQERDGETIARCLFAACDTFARGQENADDMTVVVIKMK